MGFLGLPGSGQGALGWIDEIGSLITGWAGLQAQWAALNEVNKSTQPGAQPGTSQPGTDIWAAYPQGEYGNLPTDWNVRDVTNTLAQQSATGRLVPAQWQENARARTDEQRILQENVDLAKGSRLGTLGPEVSAFQSMMQGRMQGQADTQNANYDAQRGQYAQTSANLTGEVRGLNEDFQKRMRATADNPQVATQAEMDAIAGRMMGNTNDLFSGRAGQAAQEAGQRGLSPQAVQIMQENAANENTRANLDTTATIAATNAANRAQLQFGANQALGQTGGQLYATEGNIGQGYGSLINDIMGQQSQASLAWDQLMANTGYQGYNIQGALAGQYEGGITNANLNLADLVGTPENFLAPGEMLDAYNQYALAARTGALGDLSNTSLQLSGGFGEQAASRQQNAAIRSAAADQARASIWGGGLGVGGNILGGFAQGFPWKGRYGK